MYEYTLTFSVDVAKVAPGIGALIESLNDELSTFGVRERVGCHAPMLDMKVSTPKPLTDKEIETLKVAALEALNERMPTSDFRFDSLRCQSRESGGQPNST